MLKNAVWLINVYHYITYLELLTTVSVSALNYACTMYLYSVCTEVCALCEHIVNNNIQSHRNDSTHMHTQTHENILV